MMSTGSAPGKVILFGEHAVVYGKPAIAMAIALRIRVSAIPSKRNVTTVDGHVLKQAYHAYIKYAFDNFWDGGPIEFKTHSDIPSASGLGSSAALTIATIGAIKGLEGKTQPSLEEVARLGHQTEYDVQGIASPTDTTTSTKGGGIFVSNEPGDDLLWNVSKGEKSWYLHHMDLPDDMTVVVGYSGMSSKTMKQVQKVSKVTKRSKFGQEIIDEIGDVVEDGRKALVKKDLVRLGELMNKNQKLLTIIGASSDALQALIDAVAGHSYGVKLTGAGGGGSVISLTDEPEKVAELFEKRGARAYIAKASKKGLIVEIHE
jgi:mevalonate kinase